jgi:hypothetical protein
VIFGYNLPNGRAAAIKMNPPERNMMLIADICMDKLAAGQRVAVEKRALWDCVEQIGT